MQPRLVLGYVGSLLVLVGVAMATGVPVAWFQGETSELVALALSALITAGIGLIMHRLGRKRGKGVTRRDAFAIVTAAWFGVSLFGALPYLLSGVLPGFVDAFFESASGFTTTGSSVIPDPDSIPRAILYWRSLTQWLGGMGIIVLFVAIFAELGVGGRFLFKSEVPGPITESLRPKIRDMSLALWKIYVLLTALEAGLLMITGMGAFDAVCHAFTTMSTGGFSTRTASAGAFGTPSGLIILFFMVLAGVNFSLYYHAFLGRPDMLWKDRELWTFLAILVLATLAVSFDIRGRFESPWEALEKGAFQVVSLTTTTGFATDDFNQYPAFSKLLLVVLMFVGGCAGSTAGGMKVIRLVMLLKVAHRGLYRLIRPHTVVPIRIGRQVIPDSSILEVTGFFFLFVAIFVLGTLYVAAHGIDMATSLTSVAATLSNIGPGLERVGATQHYGDLPGSVKIVLGVFMILGRLELYTVLALLMPVYWRR